MPFLLLSIILLQAPDTILTKIGIDQNLGAQVDPSLVFRDEEGTAVKLGEFFGKKPVILMPVYFGCPMLCGMQLNGLVRALKVLPFTAGREFEILTFSFDPKEGPELAAAKKAHYVRDYGRSGAVDGWRFLTGDAAAIEKLTSTLGFRYVFDVPTGQWAHASALIVLTPDGRVSQYLNGIEYDQASLKYGIMEASENRVGSVIDRVLLLCYEYDPHSGRYSLAIMRVIQIAGVVTMAALLGFVVTTRGSRPRLS